MDTEFPTVHFFENIKRMLKFPHHKGRVLGVNGKPAKHMFYLPFDISEVKKL